ncbi:MAG TPA: hypothetical protein VLS25_13880 [Dehalococcoidia bacterium]|nr:hypothetical protein [Dehalococcoidia bacterium]
MLAAAYSRAVMVASVIFHSAPSLDQRARTVKDCARDAVGLQILQHPVVVGVCAYPKPDKHITFAPGQRAIATANAG